jgi:hypothetical protein
MTSLRFNDWGIVDDADIVRRRLSCFRGRIGMRLRSEPGL